MGEPAGELVRDLEVSAAEQPGLGMPSAEGQAVLGVSVQGHDTWCYNGAYRRVGLHEGQPRFERKVIGGSSDGDVMHLYYHGPSAAWRLANSFAPEEAGCKSWIASPTGALPAGLQTWQNEEISDSDSSDYSDSESDSGSEVPLTLTQLVRDSPAQCPPLAASAPSYDKESQDRLEYTQRDMVHAHVSLQHAPRLRSSSGRCMPAALPFTFNQLRVCAHRPPRRTWQRARRRPGLRRTRKETRPSITSASTGRSPGR